MQTCVGTIKLLINKHIYCKRCDAFSMPVSRIFRCISECFAQKRLKIIILFINKRTTVETCIFFFSFFEFHSVAGLLDNIVILLKHKVIISSTLVQTCDTEMSQITILCQSYLSIGFAFSIRNTRFITVCVSSCSSHCNTGELFKCFGKKLNFSVPCE